MKAPLLKLAGSIFVLYLALAGVWSDAKADTWVVTMGSDDLFHPDSLTVQMGDTVRRVNKDKDAHTTTSGSFDCVEDGLWDSGDLEKSGEFVHTFSAAGTFTYFCEYHCSMGMHGTISVESPTPIERPSWGRIKMNYR